MSQAPHTFLYWKIRYWIDRNLAWFDIQKAYAAPREAEADARKLSHRRVRLMRVDDRGKRTPLPEIVIPEP